MPAQQNPLASNWHNTDYIYNRRKDLKAATPVARSTKATSPCLSRPKRNLRDAMHDPGLKPKDTELTEEPNFCEAKPASNRRSHRLHFRSIHVLRIAVLITILVRKTIEIGHIVDGPRPPYPIGG